MTWIRGYRVGSRKMAPISLKRGIVDDLAHELVQAVAGLEKGTDNFKIALEFAVSNFRFHRFLDVNSFDITRKLDGLRDKFRIHCQDLKANRLTALKESYLRKQFSSTLYKENTEYHFGALSLLLNLSKSPVNCGEFSETKRESVHQVEREINWKEYLLEGEEKLEIGIYISDEQRLALEEENDDEDEYFGIETIDKKDEPVNEPKAVTASTPADSDFCSKNAEEEQDLEWLQRNVIPQYWKGENAFGPMFNEREAVDKESQMINALQITSNKQKLANDLTENVIIRETIWMLQGVRTTYVYRYVNNSYMVRDDIMLSHVSHEALYEVMTSFALIGNKIQGLKSFVTDVSLIGQKQLKITRAFGYAINCFLRRARKELGDIEYKIVSKNETHTILTFEQKIVKLLADVELVYDVFTACIKVLHGTAMSAYDVCMHFIDTLFNTVCRLDSLADSGTSQMCVVIPIFLETIRPFLNDLDCWLFKGKLPCVSGDEFFVYEDENTTKDDSEAWQEQFRIRSNNKGTSFSVPQFLSDVAEKILLTGKSCSILEKAGSNVVEQATISFEKEFFENLFRGLGISWKRDETDEEVTYSDVVMVGKEMMIRDNGFTQLLQENFIVIFQRNYERFNTSRDRVHECSSIQNAIEKSKDVIVEEAACRPPFRHIFESTLHALITERYAKASNELISLLKDRFKFDTHFSVIKNFFLMEAGDVMSTFYSEVFTKIRCKEFWQSTSYLTSVLHEALQLRFPYLVSKLTAGIKSESRGVSRKFAGIQSADIIYLHYEMEWPLTIIFDNKAEEKYNAIFTFLLQVKRVLWSLEQLRINDLVYEKPRRGSEIENPISLSTRLEDSQSLVSLRQKLFMIRVRLLHFVQSFHVYIMTRILHSSGLEFQAQVNEAKDFEEVLMIHLDFLEKVYDRCLLSPKVGFAKEAITRILNLSLNFQRHWDIGLAKIKEEDILAIENEFVRCSHFIQSFLNNLIKRGSFPHLELLSLSLKM